MTNIAPEHLDYFKSFDNVKRSFNNFSRSAQMLICSSMHNFENNNKIIFEDLDCKIDSKCNNKQRIKNNNTIQPTFSASCVKMLIDGTYSFTCKKNGKYYTKIYLNLIGQYNVKNALAAIAVADYLGVDKKAIKKGLSTFVGIERRFQILNKDKFIVHDYAHHPDEIKAVISETKKFYKNKLLVVFQPHTYSRTKTLMGEFVDCFKQLNDVVIFKTYSAREKYLSSGSAKRLCENIGDSTVYFKNKQKLASFVKEKVASGYGVLFIGAGDIFEIAKNVTKLC